MLKISLLDCPTNNKDVYFQEDHVSFISVQLDTVGIVKNYRIRVVLLKTKTSNTQVNQSGRFFVLSNRFCRIPNGTGRNLLDPRLGLILLGHNNFIKK